jgi:hypothetical protein
MSSAISVVEKDRKNVVACEKKKLQPLETRNHLMTKHHIFQPQAPPFSPTVYMSLKEESKKRKEKKEKEE